jgi:hypothetical protein
MSHNDDWSYLESGISAASVEKLFEAAQLLYRAAPWKADTGGALLRMDVPALGVDGACVAIVGQRDPFPGLLIFPSLAGFESFELAAESLAGTDEPVDFGTGWIALSFDRGERLTPRMRREIAEHRWPIAGRSAHPKVERFAPYGEALPPSPHDVAVATACASALPAFVLKHRAAFADDGAPPLCESWFDADDLEVRFTLPYEAFPLFETDDSPQDRAAAAAAAPPPKAGRNDPCPCGSGRKYKKCCLARDEEDRGARASRAAIHERDERWVYELAGWAERRFGADALACLEDFQDPERAIQLALPWSVYGAEVQGRPVVAWYLDERGRRLDPADRAWLEAQQAGWLSVWEVREVERGASLLLEDLLTGELRRVREVSGSQTIEARSALLARVIDHEGASLLCGAHPQPLPPRSAAAVVERARARLRRRRAVPPDRLRDAGVARALIRYWEEEVLLLFARSAGPTVLTNTDGDPLLLTIDHFEVAPGARPAVERALAALEGAHDDDTEDEAERSYTFLKEGNPVHASWDNTVIGIGRLSDAGLALETNSRERADALRARVEAACGDGIRHRAREHSDPLSARAPRPAAQPAAQPPELQAIVREHKQRHYRAWIDDSLPALGGKTPRESVRSARGREAVDLLLKEIEQIEERGPAGERFDVSELRRALGLA